MRYLLDRKISFMVTRIWNNWLNVPVLSEILYALGENRGAVQSYVQQLVCWSFLEAWSCVGWEIIELRMWRLHGVVAMLELLKLCGLREIELHAWRLHEVIVTMLELLKVCGLRDTWTKFGEIARSSDYARARSLELDSVQVFLIHGIRLWLFCLSLYGEVKYHVSLSLCIWLGVACVFKSTEIIF